MKTNLQQRAKEIYSYLFKRWPTREALKAISFRLAELEEADKLELFVVQEINNHVKTNVKQKNGI